jgi:hypothetical protein
MVLISRQQYFNIPKTKFWVRIVLLLCNESFGESTILDSRGNIRKKIIRTFTQSGSVYLGTTYTYVPALEKSREYKGLSAIYQKLRHLFPQMNFTEESLKKLLLKAIEKGNAREESLKNHFTIFIFPDCYLKDKKRPDSKTKFICQAKHTIDFPEETVEEMVF